MISTCVTRNIEEVVGASTSHRKKHFSKRKKQITAIPAEKLEIGMFVSKLDRPWRATPFVFQGFLLGSQRDIEIVSRYCDWAYIDVTKFIHFIGRSRELGSGKPNFYAYSTITISTEEQDKSVFQVIAPLNKRERAERKIAEAPEYMGQLSINTTTLFKPRRQSVHPELN